MDAFDDDDRADELYDAAQYLRAQGLKVIATSDRSMSSYWALCDEPGAPQLRLSDHDNVLCRERCAVDVRPDDDLDDAIERLRTATAQWEQLGRPSTASADLDALMDVEIERALKQGLIRWDEWERCHVEVDTGEPFVPLFGAGRDG